MLEFTTRQQEIIEQAIELIHEGGIQSVTMKNLSKRLGISEPAIYRHFKSKRAILLSMLEQFKQRSKDHLSRTLESEGTSIIRLKTVFLEHSGQFVTNPHMTAVVFSEEAFQDDSRFSETVFAVMSFAHDTIVDIIADAQKAGDIRTDIPREHLALIVLGALRLMVKRWRLSNYSFDLKQESGRVWASLQTLLVIEK
ncbi:MAG: TetR/AcrR family transcriptional regulator [bacterium]|nr:TetR/AcrR family transcriptional regulator [bacterium]